MTTISFYHLQQTPLEKALPKLLEKVYSAGKRVVVLANTEEKVEMLNSVLWTYTTKFFLPHGSKKDGFAADQPIYLTTQEENPNQATIVVATCGEQPVTMDQFERCLDMFDGNDEASLSAARERFRTYKAAGYEVNYWKQNAAGGWEQG